MFIKYLIMFGVVATLFHFIYTKEVAKFKYHTCRPIINGTYFNRTGFKISIATNGNSWLLLKPVLKCRYELTMKSSGVRALNISLVYENPNRLNALPCSTFDRIEFLVSTFGKPVKTVTCTDSGNWIIRWPWDLVVMDIYLSDQTNSSVYNTNESSVDVLITRAVGYFKNIYDKWNKEEIKLPSKSKSKSAYCLGKNNYQIVYRRNYYRYSRGKTKNARFRLINKSFCIKTYSPSTWRNKCKWKVYLVVSERVVMVLQCKRIYDYWCLPNSWLDHSDYLEVNFVSTSDAYSYQTYTINIMANASYGKRCSYTTTTTTTSYWSSWSSWSSYDKVDYSSSKKKISGAIFIPIAIVAVIICAIICCASYMRSSRTTSNTRLNANQFGVPENYNQNRNTDGEDSVRNPAYRMHDPVRGPITPGPGDDTERNPAYRRHDPLRGPLTPGPGDETVRNPAYRMHDPVRGPLTPGPGDETERNPAYRRHDPLRGPATSRPADPGPNYSYSDPPPNYSRFMNTSPSTINQDTAQQPEHLSLVPSPVLPTAPPPSYEAALDMIDTPDTRQTEHVPMISGNTIL